MSARRLLVALLTLIVIPALWGCADKHRESSASRTSRTEPSPHELEDELGFDQAGILARQSRVEASIHDCMKARGFRYVPVDPVAQRAAVTGTARLTDEDFLRGFGYGISTLWGRRSGGGGADHNRRLRAALPARARRQYDRALWGAHPGATFQAAVDSGDFTDLGGCTRRATGEVFGGARLLTWLQSKLDELDDRIVADARMVRAIARWRACMRRAGYRYEDPDDIDGALTRKMQRIVGPIPGPFASGPVGRSGRRYDPAELAALQREELATARADLSCEKRWIEPVETRVRPRYEREFRTKNAELIQQVKPVR